LSCGGDPIDHGDQRAGRALGALGAGELGGGVEVALADGRDRALSNNVIAASRQARIGSFGSQRTPRRTSPLLSQNRAPPLEPPDPSHPWYERRPSYGRRSSRSRSPSSHPRRE